MHRELLVLRHGKSDWSRGVSDLARPLERRGVREAEKVGRWLLDQDLVPDHIICSPAERARLTAEIVGGAMGFDIGMIQTTEGIYMADIEDLQEVIRSIPQSVHRAMLIGHNPGLEELVDYISDEKLEIPEDGKLLPTATVACLYLKVKWADVGAETCSLISLNRGRQL